MSAPGIPTQLFEQLSAPEKAEIAQFVEGESQKARIHGTVHHLTKICWKKCVQTPIRTGGFEKGEETCARNCVGRFMDGHMAVLEKLEQMRGMGG
ncbi:MAG: Mitochondrial import inner membrane translocase subunit tim8 [Piccolia ochrophora]|nr:MAG: Mitochondrial import inner membrane translocase subunit tim8 [Piccolia ochrophora]